MADIFEACSSHGRNFGKQKKRFNFRAQESPRPGPSPSNTPRRNQQHHWKNKNRPSFFRLDSTGENSASSSEDLNGGFSPEIQVFNRCSRSSRKPRFPEQEHRSFTENHQTQSQESCGLLDKVKCAFGTRNQYLPSHSRRNTRRNLAHPIPSNNPDTRLASLDSVAEKFTNMNMENVNNKHWGSPNWQGQHAEVCRGPTNRGPQGQWGRTSNVPYDSRNHTPIFHPYQGMNQSPLLSSTLNYQRNFFPQPWQHMMGFNHNGHLPFNQGFHHFAQPWQHQQRSHPPYPWQQWIGPQMMQACGNQGLMTRQQHHEKARSPKKQKWSRCQSNQKKRTCPQSESRPLAEKSQPSTKIPLQVPSNAESPVDKLALVAEVKEDDMLSKDEPLVDLKKDVDGAIYSAEESKIEHDKKYTAVQSEKIESQTSLKPEVHVPKVQDEHKTQNEAVQRHSTIDLILSDYEVQSCTQGEITTLSTSSDSEDSDGDSDSAVETNADLWESFTVTDDPYNPLCGWRCRKSIQEVCPGTMSIQDCHVDSGTDEGDNWSETDSDDDYDSADDIPDDVPDDVHSSLPRSLKLSDPQLKELRENLSSTPKDKTDQAPIHHPSLAFILGSQSSSSEDDDDWDTLDDQSNLQDDPLWDSFNRARDPYSPMEAWKCSASKLSSSIAPCSSNQSTPMRKQDSVEGLRTILIASAERKTSPQLCEEASPLDSDGESFPISTVRVYAARDDIDLGSPNVSVASLKRVASASCLRRVQLTPQDKANKKVRFCPNSSFIVLVEKDSLLPCENVPGQAAENDWQACARDRMRFKARIDQLSQLLNPVLANEHRERVYASRMAPEGYR